MIEYIPIRHLCDQALVLPAWKALIEEEFGDGIMSAIDFDMTMERVANEKGDRVKISMSGKFLPFKYYENEQGIPAYGFKEE